VHGASPESPGWLDLDLDEVSRVDISRLPRAALLPSGLKCAPNGDGGEGPLVCLVSAVAVDVLDVDHDTGSVMGEITLRPPRQWGQTSTFTASLLREGAARV